MAAKSTRTATSILVTCFLLFLSFDCSFASVHRAAIDGRFVTTVNYRTNPDFIQFVQVDEDTNPNSSPESPVQQSTCLANGAVLSTKLRLFFALFEPHLEQESLTDQLAQWAKTPMSHADLKQNQKNQLRAQQQAEKARKIKLQKQNDVDADDNSDDDGKKDENVQSPKTFVSKATTPQLTDQKPDDMRQKKCNAMLQEKLVCLTATAASDKCVPSSFLATGDRERLTHAAMKLQLSSGWLLNDIQSGTSGASKVVANNNSTDLEATAQARHRESNMRIVTVLLSAAKSPKILKQVVSNKISPPILSILADISEEDAEWIFKSSADTNEMSVEALREAVSRNNHLDSKIRSSVLSSLDILDNSIFPTSTTLIKNVLEAQNIPVAKIEILIKVIMKGSINKDELMTLTGLSASDTDKIFKIMDKDSNGDVTYSELREWALQGADAVKDVYVRQQEEEAQDHDQQPQRFRHHNNPHHQTHQQQQHNRQVEEHSAGFSQRQAMHRILDNEFGQLNIQTSEDSFSPSSSSREHRHQKQNGHRKHHDLKSLTQEKDLEEEAVDVEEVRAKLKVVVNALDKIVNSQMMNLQGVLHGKMATIFEQLQNEVLKISKGVHKISDVVDNGTSVYKTVKTMFDQLSSYFAGQRSIEVFVKVLVWGVIYLSCLVIFFLALHSAGILNLKNVLAGLTFGTKGDNSNETEEDSKSQLFTLEDIRAVSESPTQSPSPTTPSVTSLLLSQQTLVDLSDATTSNATSLKSSLLNSTLSNPFLVTSISPPISETDKLYRDLSSGFIMGGFTLFLVAIMWFYVEHYVFWKRYGRTPLSGVEIGGVWSWYESEDVIALLPVLVMSLPLIINCFAYLDKKVGSVTILMTLFHLMSVVAALQFVAKNFLPLLIVDESDESSMAEYIRQHELDAMLSDCDEPMATCVSKLFVKFISDYDVQYKDCSFENPLTEFLQDPQNRQLTSEMVESTSLMFLCNDVHVVSSRKKILQELQLFETILTRLSLVFQNQVKSVPVEV
eukprot:c12206_g1_i1.p1 GENE.c12206_g1_i1~~c12206_g1_i1.p1  ORF type:complete len:1015 (-),score=259.74 c12206_g1_i1:66-3110(-)